MRGIWHDFVTQWVPTQVLFINSVPNLSRVVIVQKKFILLQFSLTENIMHSKSFEDSEEGEWRITTNSLEVGNHDVLGTHNGRNAHDGHGDRRGAGTTWHPGRKLLGRLCKSQVHAHSAWHGAVQAPSYLNALTQSFFHCSPGFRIR